MANTTHKPIVVAILNSNDELVELMRVVLEQAGFVAVTGHVDDARRGELDLINFMRQHDPKVIVYDLVPPYDRSWNYLRVLQDTEVMKNRSLVLTSVNAERAQEVVGRSKIVHEVIGRPVDLDEMITAVKEASKRR
jgi:DNA-binding response OmpR family regulator